MDRIFIAAGLLAAMSMTAALALFLLWALGIGNDPLVLLADAPF